MVLVAMLAVAVPTAVAQVPVTDQYQTPDHTTPVAQGNPVPPVRAEDSSIAPVQVVNRAPATAGDSLPFTGAQISLVALIGLALLALGAIGLAATRRRTPSAAS